MAHWWSEWLASWCSKWCKEAEDAKTPRESKTSTQRNEPILLTAGIRFEMCELMLYAT